MKKVFALVFALFLLAGTSAVKAQEATGAAYKNAIGLSLGNPSGISWKHALGKNYLEADFGMGFDGNIDFTGLYLWNFSINSVQGLGWYAGAGASLGTWKNSNDDSEFRMAARGAVGLEYNLPKLPINLTLDWRPAIDFTGGGFHGDEFSFGIRYILGGK